MNGVPPQVGMSCPFDPNEENHRLLKIVRLLRKSYPLCNSEFRFGFHQRSIINVSVTFTGSFPVLSEPKRTDLAENRTDQEIAGQLRQLRRLYRPYELLRCTYHLFRLLLIHSQIEYGSMVLDMRKRGSTTLSITHDTQVKPDRKDDDPDQEDGELDQNAVSRHTIFTRIIED